MKKKKKKEECTIVQYLRQLVGVRYCGIFLPGNNNNNNINNNNNTINNNINNNINNINNKDLPNPCSGQRTLVLIGWFEGAVILYGGTKTQKQQSHRSNSGYWIGVLVTLIGCQSGTDPYGFMKEHVISIAEVSCEAGTIHQPLTMPNQLNCVCEVVDKQ